MFTQDTFCIWWQKQNERVNSPSCYFTDIIFLGMPQKQDQQMQPQSQRCLIMALNLCHFIVNETIRRVLTDH